MNKVKIENIGGGKFVVTLPMGGQSVPMSAADVVERLKDEEKRYEAALENMRTRRQEMESIVSSET